VIRRLFELASILSLMLCVATCGLWVRSYWVADTLRYYGRVREGRLTSGSAGSDDGTLWADWGATYIPAELSAEYDHKFYDEWNPELIRGWSVASAEPSPDPGPVARLVHVVYRADHQATRIDVEYAAMFASAGLELPHWVLVLAFASSPIVSAVQRRRAGRMRSRGLCPSCGYDLRASPKCCPECGAVPAVKGAT
jgi:hypothetical protein